LFGFPEFLYQTDIRLCQAIFDHPIFQAWAKGTHRLHLYLDSLDERLLRIDTLASLLVEEFQKYSVSRLYVRIACRTADWPNSLEDGLEQLYSKGAVGVYELAPLKRVDVAEAARANNLDPEVFLQEIDRKEIVPLASKPVTLNLLLNIYWKHGQFPSTQAELYFAGCRLLCEESNESRRDARRTGDLTAEQRMIVAARIAAITIFASRYAIWTGLDQGDVTEEDVTIRGLGGGREYVNGEGFEVSEAALRETLDTGLFSSRGRNRMGWAHQTYAEFLAARYLVQHETTLAQIMSLITHPGDLDRKLVPQLHETAAWLAGMMPGAFREIMNVAPEVLLRSDVATADVKDRAALVKALLESCNEERLLIRDLYMSERFKKLAHPKLAQQLRLYILDRTKSAIARSTAIDIAEACELQILQTDLANIALDVAEPLQIRTDSAYAVCRAGSSEIKAMLKPLALGTTGEDPEDDLKGCGLQAVWPGHMTAKELFKVLTPPKREDYYGAYQQFLSGDFVQRMQTIDLPLALTWIESLGSRHLMPHSFRQVIDKLMYEAWKNLESPEVLTAFAKSVLPRLRQYDAIVEDAVTWGVGPNAPLWASPKDDGKRHQVLMTVVPLLSNPEDAACLIYSRPPLVLSRDIPWMVDQLQTPHAEDQDIWIYMIKRVFRWQEPNHLHTILAGRRHNVLLAQAFPWLPMVVALHVPFIFQIYWDWKLRRWQPKRRVPQQPPVKPAPLVRIVKLLDEIEAGNSAAWWRLNLQMTLEPNSTRYGDESEYNLTELPGWMNANVHTRTRIVEAAKRYVLEQGPELDEGQGTTHFDRPAQAGYRALRLLLLKEPAYVSTLPADVWIKWAPVLVGHLPSRGSEDEEMCRSLIQIAYQPAAKEIIDSLMLVLDHENSTHGDIYTHARIDKCWDSRLENALLNKMSDVTLKPESLGRVLTSLLLHKSKEAERIAAAFVPVPPPASDAERLKATVVARTLLTHAADAGWSTAWPAIQQDVDFGKTVMTQVSFADRHTASIGKRLSEAELANLYVWLEHQYPHIEDPKHDGAYEVGPRESIADWRDSILRYLRERGTPHACEAIRRIAIEFPNLPWLKWTLLEAQESTRRHTWVPPQPSDILRIASDQQSRLVQSGDELLGVLIESLKRLEAKLHGEIPAVEDLWDRIDKNSYRPKDENSLSNYVQRHLDEDLGPKGIVANREVQIHRGERTDIHVDAIAYDSHGQIYDRVTTIIEVKGCWNPELNTAMETQLVDRYLADNHCQHGLYLVGWYNCDQWDGHDHRKNDAPKLGIDEARLQFDTQATQLSQQGKQIKALLLDATFR